MTTLLRLFEELAADPAAKARFAAEPDRFLDDSGFGGLPPEDMAEALAHAADTFPPALAAQVDPSTGLQSLAEVDLQHLGLNGVDDFASVWEPTASGEPAPDPPKQAILAEDSTLDEPPPDDEPHEPDAEPASPEHSTALDDPLTPDPLTQDPLTQDPVTLDDPDWGQNADPLDEVERFQMEELEGDVGDELL